MKKSLILAGMLAVGYANAQEGNVGINTENPKATLEVLPNVKNAEATATTNEGIVAPKLSKTRIANIAEANLVEGTLVYATDATYTGNNTKVAKITEKGYYFYDGTEWVKAGATPVDQLWAKRGQTTYLIPADEDGNVVRYTKEIGLQSMMRNSEATTGSFYGGSFNVENSNTANDLNGVRTNIRNTGAVQNSIRGFYSDVHAQTQKDGAYAASTLNNIFGSDSNIYVTPNTTLTGAAVGVRGNAILYENSTTKNAYGSIFNYTANQNANVENLYGVRINPTISTNANVTNHYGLYINNVNSNGVKGENFSIYTNSGIVSFWDRVGIGTRTPSQKLEVVGNIYANSGRLMSEINTATGGELSLINNTKVDGAVNRWTIFNMNNIGEFSYAPGLHFWAYAADGTNLSSQMVITDAGNLRVGFPSRDTNADDLGNKLEVKGTTRITSLAGKGLRNVVADENGVLQVGSSADAEAGKVASTTGMQCNAENRGKMNFIQGADGKSDVFGICMKNADGKYYWGYMVGGNNPTNGEGAFGSGL